MTSDHWEEIAGRIERKLLNDVGGKWQTSVLHCELPITLPKFTVEEMIRAYVDQNMTSQAEAAMTGILNKICRFYRAHTTSMAATLLYELQQLKAGHGPKEDGNGKTVREQLVLYVTDPTLM
jgi:proline dehydrogenase